tara:strand:+ start:1324 stop:1563 length:240 start_codon:yes stop_codon:yes gene_type:complete
MDYGIIGTLCAGGFMAGMWNLGRWSVKRKIVDLELIKTQLMLSMDNHEELIEEIDSKIKEIEEYSSLRFYEVSKNMYKD